MNKTTIVSIIIAGLIIGGVVYFSSSKNNEISNNPVVINNTATTTIIITQGTTTSTVTVSGNVSMENGIQIINLEAKGGYAPRGSLAKAGIPTVIRFKTNNAFDCSRSVRISSLNISQLLPQTGTTDINIGIQPAGLFRGSCGMGMYPFEVDFK